MLTILFPYRKADVMIWLTYRFYVRIVIYPREIKKFFQGVRFHRIFLVKLVISC